MLHFTMLQSSSADYERTRNRSQTKVSSKFQEEINVEFFPLTWVLIFFLPSTYFVLQGSLIYPAYSKDGHEEEVCSQLFALFWHLSHDFKATWMNCSTRQCFEEEKGTKAKDYKRPSINLHLPKFQPRYRFCLGLASVFWASWVIVLIFYSSDNASASPSRPSLNWNLFMLSLLFCSFLGRKSIGILLSKRDF